MKKEIIMVKAKKIADIIVHPKLSKHMVERTVLPVEDIFVPQEEIGVFLRAEDICGGE